MSPDRPRDRPHRTPADANREKTDPEQPDDAAVLPANAAGETTSSSEEREQGIDSESMYDRRPEEDKDRPPSSHRVP